MCRVYVLKTGIGITNISTKRNHGNGINLALQIYAYHYDHQTSSDVDKIERANSIVQLRFILTYFHQVSA